MNPWIIALIAVMVLAIIVITLLPTGRKVDRMVALEELCRHEESTMTPIEGFENSYQIAFRHNDIDFTFEDIEDAGYRMVLYKGYLKAKAASSLTVTFTEKVRTSIRSSAKKISDFAQGWGMDDVQVHLPSELKRFEVHTNDPRKAVKLFDDEKIAKIFSRYRTQGTRGYPIMSLEIIEGIVVLKFHSTGLMRPLLQNLWRNVTGMDEYANVLTEVVRKLEAIEKEDQ